MKTKIRNINFRPESRERIEQMVEIIDEYEQQGLRLSARQTYYQFVARGLIPCESRSCLERTVDLTDDEISGTMRA